MLVESYQQVLSVGPSQNEQMESNMHHDQHEQLGHKYTINKFDSPELETPIDMNVNEYNQNGNETCIDSNVGLN